MFDHATAKIERKIVRAIVKSAIAEGLTVTVFDGEDIAIAKSHSVGAIMGAMFTTDSDMLRLYKPGEPGAFAWIQLVYGNGVDVVSDYTTNIEPLMAPIADLADRLG